jgi:YebC/PmpR family DNA-binding regulatory protein
MGRAFEFRKGRKLKRWGAMAKSFTKIGKQIAMAVKSGGPDPNNNPVLRMVIVSAKAVNMPKVNVDGAIKRASSKEEKDYEEIIYEGYGPYGIPVLVETATDNPTRTVANVRMYFSKANGSLGTTGSVSFMFERKCIFNIKNNNFNLEDLELELIDFGLDEITADDETNELVVQCAFEEYGHMQKGLEAKFEILSSSIVWIPATTKELNDEQAEEFLAMIERMEEDEDVISVYHNLA